jgi:multidrug efflux pump subunit AcrA (membrane-fusion protein)
MMSPVVYPISRTSRAEITVDNRKGLLKPGMFARVELIVREEKSTVVVPADAILGRVGRYAFVVEQGKAVRKPVSLGIRENNRVQVIEGLGASDTLIVVGQRVVDDGEEVTIVVE